MAVLSAFPRRARAQDEDEAFLFSVDAVDGSPIMRVGTLFEDDELTQALHSGLPLRVQVQLELWKDGFFDRQRGRADWRASILYDPLARRYRIQTGDVGSAEIRVDSLAFVGTRLEESFRPDLAPAERGRFYYRGQVDVQTLSLSDLDDLERWLQGDVDRSDDAREVTAIGRGLRRLFVSILSLPSRRFKIRTPTFEFDPEG